MRGGHFIATTWIKPTYAHKGYTNKATIKRKINYITDSEKANIDNEQTEPNNQNETFTIVPSIFDYVQNTDKTQNNALVKGYECCPENAADEFANSMDMYEINTGREHKDNSRMLYHMRQSFKPGEVDAITANRIGYELALEFTKGNHAFVIATHTDKAHFHNHVIFNAFNLESDGKFQDPWFSGKRDIARISDRLCKEYGLSVIEVRQGWSDPYNIWEKKKGITKEDKPMPKRRRLEEVIGFCLDKEPRDFNQFLKYLEDYSCFAKRRGANISITTPFSKSPIRLSSLKDEFTEEGIKAQIENRKNNLENNTTFVNHKTTKTRTNISDVDSIKPKELRLIIDIHKSMKATQNIGYRKWAEKFNLEQMSQTLIFIEKHQLSLDDLENMAKQNPKTLANIKDEIANHDAQLKHISLLQRHIGTYGKTKEVYKQFKQSANPEQFRIENDKAISDHEQARAYFDACGYGFESGNKLPKITELREQYAKHDATKKSLWAKYHEVKNADKEIVNAWTNVKAILNLPDEVEIETLAPQIQMQQPEIMASEIITEIVLPEVKLEIQAPETPKPKRKRNEPSL